MNKLVIVAFALGLNSVAFAENNNPGLEYEVYYEDHIEGNSLAQLPKVGDSRRSSILTSLDNDKELGLEYEVYYEDHIEGNSLAQPPQVGDSRRSSISSSLDNDKELGLEYEVYYEDYIEGHRQKYL